ncbi:MAG: hypothetical protein ABIN99_04310 [Nitrosospira sp.]
MGRRADTAETKALKKRLTEEFVRAIENGGKAEKPEILERAFSIGGVAGTGIVWCAYRRGARSMSFPSLRTKIRIAVDGGYITREIADTLLGKLPPDSGEVEKSKMPKSEDYFFDPSILFCHDMIDTTALLVEQARQLRNKISYGHAALEDAHYYYTVLDILKPIQVLIQNLLTKKHQEEIRLEERFGNENYREIKPVVRRMDAGYTPQWWITPQSEAAKVELDKAAAGLVKWLKDEGLAQ